MKHTINSFKEAVREEAKQYMKDFAQNRTRESLCDAYHLIKAMHLICSEEHHFLEDEKPGAVSAAVRV